VRGSLVPGPLYETHETVKANQPRSNVQQIHEGEAATASIAPVIVLSGYFFFHRALAPLAAICVRFLAGRAAARARPPLRPNATAAGSFLAGGSVLTDSPMDSRKT